MPMIYLIGSLRNPEIPHLGNRLRALGFEIFDNWFAGGERADDSWQEYNNIKDFTYAQALASPEARNIFEFDKRHLDCADAAVLVMPGGKSAHLELGYMIGRGKPAWILFEETPPRYDVMYLFADGVFFGEAELVQAIQKRFPK